MKTNQFTTITGLNTVLVPYDKRHVHRYHVWMQSEDLQQLTASEPLTLEEEYEMQQTWLNDDDKCTFIVLDRQLFESSNRNDVESMVGDVNLFLNTSDDDNHHHQVSAEIEIMIAEPACRGRGLGREAVVAMMFYGVKYLNVDCFRAKIGLKNELSRALFEKLGFVEVCRSEVFQEVTSELPVTSAVCEWLKQQTSHLTICEHDVTFNRTPDDD